MTRRCHYCGARATHSVGAHANGVLVSVRVVCAAHRDRARAEPEIRTYVERQIDE